MLDRKRSVPTTPDRDPAGLALRTPADPAFLKLVEIAGEVFARSMRMGDSVVQEVTSRIVDAAAPLLQGAHGPVALELVREEQQLVARLEAGGQVTELRWPLS
jgi:hypothetical protein